MRGHFSTAVLDDYARAEARGQHDGTPLEFTVTVSSDDLGALLSSPTHTARIDGSIACPARAAQPLQVVGGEFQLLVKDPSRVNARQMTYRMNGVCAARQSYTLAR